MGRKLAPKAVAYTKADGTTSYRVRLRVNGRQTTETFDNEVAANVFISRMIDPAIGPERAVEMRDREDPVSTNYVPTLRELLATHVEGLTGVEDHTREEYLRAAARSWLPMLGALRVDEIRRDDAAKWVNKAAGGSAPKTIKNQFSILSATMNTAVAKGYILGNPVRGIRLPRAGEEDVEDPNFLTHTEFDRLFREFPESAHPLIIHLFGMGMRWSEATAQQPRDIDRDAGQHVGDDWIPAPTAKVVRAWKRGGKIGPPKSKAARRAVVIPPEVLDVVEPLLDGLPSDGWIFRTSTGAAMTHSNFFNRVWKPATMRASICEKHRADRCRCFASKPYLCTVHTAKDENGHTILPEPCGCPGTIPFRPRIHDARHTHASWLIARGVRLEVIQERLGHEDYLTTRRLYGHLMPDAQLAAGAAASVAFAQTALGLHRETRAKEIG